MKKEVAFLLKFFSEEKHRDEFISGILFTNSMNYYVKNESERDRGRGDKLEGIVRAENVENIVIQNAETGANALIPLSNLTAQFDGYSDVHIFCMTIMENDWLKETNKGRQYVIPDEVLKVFRKEYGEYVCLIPAKEFLEQVIMASENRNLDKVYNTVRYFDVKKYWAERMIASDGDKFFFQKDLRYSVEHEFRIAFKNIHGHEPVRVHLGSTIRVIDEVRTIDDLVNYLEKVVITLHGND